MLNDFIDAELAMVSNAIKTANVESDLEQLTLIFSKLMETRRYQLVMNKK